MIAAPRKSKKTKRASAPSNGLANDIKRVQAMPTIKDEDVAPTQAASNNSADNGDLLDLFSFGGGGGAGYAANTGAQADDFLSLFDDTPGPATRPTSQSTSQARNTVNTLQIHPNLQNPRESRSLRPDALFDVSMWDNFGDDSGQAQKPQQNLTAAAGTGTAAVRNSTQGFEPINIQQGKKKKKAAPESSSEEEEDEEEDDEEDEKEKKKTVVVAPKKPRASAPPTTIKSGTSKAVVAAAAPAERKETNALEELHRGAALLKYPRRSGFPHFKHIQLSQDNLRIEWFSKRKNLDQTCIWIKDVREVVRGQETEVFKKFHQKTLEKSSFSVVYGHSYKTLDVAAKSIDEAEMWVKAILKLADIYKQNKKEQDLIKLRELYVGIYFKDRNRPMSRAGSGNFIRANSSKNLKIDPVAIKEIERDMEALHKNYHKTAQMAQKPNITRSNQYANIQYVLSELEERIEELTYEVANIRDTELAKREVWRANVDLSAIQEKVEVLAKHLTSKTDRRKSNFL